MKTELKLFAAVLLTYFVLIFSGGRAEKYELFNHTGLNLNRLYLYEGAVANVRSDTGYTLLAESCEPFTATLNNEVAIKGDPQVVIDVECEDSYYMQQSTSSPTVITATEGGVYLSFLSEQPVGVTMGFPRDVAEKSVRDIKVVAFLVLIVGYLLIWKYLE